MMERMHRFFIAHPLEPGKLILTNKDLVHQLTRVLRVKSGGEFVLFSTEPQHAGWDFVFRVAKVSMASIEGEIVEKIKNDREPKFVLTLYQSIPKKDKMEWILEKGTEIGVSAFVPIVSEHSVKMSLNYERVGKVLKEAAEQSGRGIIPECRETMSFAEALASIKKEGSLSILAHEKESAHRLDSLPLSNQKINLFIGPEGGFSEAEVAEAKAAGLFVVSLSRRVLRSETAAITASYFLLHRFGY